MEDYEALEGKIIDYLNSNGKTKGKVVGCDPDIGITIVAAGDPTNYLMCLQGPLSPLWPKEKRKGFNKKRSKIIFNAIVNQIKKGTCNFLILEKKWRSLKGNEPSIASVKRCPFAQ